MGYNYDRSKKAGEDSLDWKVAAPRRKKTPEPVRQKPTVEKFVAEALAGEVSQAISKAASRDGFAEKLKDFKAGPVDDSYSDGTSPSRSNYNDLGYAWTVRFPSKVYATAAFDLTLSDDWKREAKREADFEDLVFTDDEIEAAGKKVDLVALVKENLAGIMLLPETVGSLPDNARRGVEEAIEQELDQSIEAYSEGEGTVELAEYPSVYFMWKGALKKVEPSVSASGSKITVTLKVEWRVGPTRWSYDSSARMSEWYHAGY